MIENAVQFFNSYAFAQVAIYGLDFRTASKATWQLFKKTFVMLLVNFDLSHMVIGLGVVMGGVVAGLAGGTWAFIFAHKAYVPFAAASFVIGVLVASLLLVVVESAVTTTFVCFAEDSEELSRYTRR